MFLHEAKQILKTFLLLCPCNPGYKLRAGAQLNEFQRAVIVFSIVLCRSSFVVVGIAVLIA